MLVELSTYTKEFLELSWKWLNDPEIKTLTDAAEFTKQEQEKWFHSLPLKKDYKIWGVICDGQPIGVTGIKKITGIDGEYWGYIGEKNYWGKGIGSQMLNIIEQEAAGMKLTSIWLQVLTSNERALQLYVKNGYQVEFIKGDTQVMRKWF